MVRQRDRDEQEPTRRSAKDEEVVEGDTDQEVVDHLRRLAREATPAAAGEDRSEVEQQEAETAKRSTEDAGKEADGGRPEKQPADPSAVKPGAEGQPQKRSRRGFAAMDPELRREIARRGGAASHEHGRAHEWSAEEARSWARQGGKIAHQRGKAHEWDTEEAREAGRRGGLARWGRERRAAEEKAKAAAPEPGYQADAEETGEEEGRLGGAAPPEEGAEREPRRAEREPRRAGRSSYEEEQLGREREKRPEDEEQPPKKRPSRGRR